MSEGITNEHLDEMCRVCKIPNIYLFCSKDQVPQFLNYAIEHKLNFDILAWHKTDPTPMCGNKYLSDTEYIIFMRGKGAMVYGEYKTKRKYWVTKANTKDKKLYGHPTCKPVDIVQTLIHNSSSEGAVVLDPFIGSGTTAIACIKEKRHFIGYEADTDYFSRALKRIEEQKRILTFDFTD